MKASVVIDVSLDMDRKGVKYDVALREGGCTGVNQLAQNLMGEVRKILVPSPQNKRGTQVCKQ